MKNLKINPTSLLLIILLLISCEKEEFYDDTFLRDVSVSPINIISSLKRSLVSEWPFQYNMQDKIRFNDFKEELLLNTCCYDYVNGKTGKGLHIRVGQIKCEGINPVLTKDRSFSFVFWAKGYNQQDNQYYFSLRSDLNTANYLNLIVAKDFNRGIYDYNAYINTTGNNYFPVEMSNCTGWNFYSISYENDDLKLYVNGQLGVTIYWNVDLYSKENYYILFSPIRSPYLNDIYIDDAKLYNKALNEIEIQTLYNMEK